MEEKEKAKKKEKNKLIKGIEKEYNIWGGRKGQTPKICITK